jgi:hypothetical protein
MTGGIGRKNLTVFYRDNFIFRCAQPALWGHPSFSDKSTCSNPRDARLELISRTVGSDRIVDEFIFHMTHDTAVDWLLPGVLPTGKTLAIPMVAIVNVHGDRLAHGAWSAVVDIAVLNARLYRTHYVGSGRCAAPGGAPAREGADAERDIPEASCRRRRRGPLGCG